MDVMDGVQIGTLAVLWLIAFLATRPRKPSWAAPVSGAAPAPPPERVDAAPPDGPSVRGPGLTLM